MRSREEDALVGRDTFRACSQWQPQLNKKRDFLSIMFPRGFLPHGPLHREQGKKKKSCPRFLAGLGHDRGTDRNRRVSAPLSPILYLFLAPAGRLYQKVQRLLSEDETAEGSTPPVMIKHLRPGPKHPAYGIPASQWPIVVHRVVEQKEPLRTVAAAYSVSHETTRRIILHAHQQSIQQEA